MPPASLCGLHILSCYVSRNRVGLSGLATFRLAPKRQPTDGRRTPLKNVVHCSFLRHTQHTSWCRSFSAPHQKHFSISFTLPPKAMAPCKRHREPSVDSHCINRANSLSSMLPGNNIPRFMPACFAHSIPGRYSIQTSVKQAGL